jgi:hypothetical protein
VAADRLGLLCYKLSGAAAFELDLAFTQGKGGGLWKIYWVVALLVTFSVGKVGLKPELLP